MDSQTRIKIPVQKSALSDALKKSKVTRISYSREFILSRQEYATRVNIPEFLYVTGTSRRFTQDMDYNSYKHGSAPTRGESRSFPEMFNSLKLDSFSNSFDPIKDCNAPLSNTVAALDIEDGCSVIKIPRVLYNGMDGTMVLPRRIWKKAGQGQVDGRHFMIMSYNVLAPFYGTEEKFNLTDPQHLDWEYRRRKILDEIIFYSPDFVCLQEIQESDFDSCFLAELQGMGYQGHFQKKKRGHSADGCAIFYQTSRFSLLNVQAFAYHERMPLNIPEYLKKRLCLFSNIALVCVFQNRFAKSLKVRVVTTHLHWDPDYSDIKLLQASILVEWLESNDTTLPTVIAGDFNSKPGEPVIDYLIRGKVFPSKMQSLQNGEDLATIDQAGLDIPRGDSPFVFDSSVEGAEEAKLHMNTFAIQRQGVKLASAYNGRDLPFTNKTPEFEGVIDHILYSSGTLSVRDVLGDVYIPSKVSSDLLNCSSTTLVGGSLDLTDDSFFSPESLDSFKQPEMTSFLSSISSLPSCHFPSDHISLCAWLKWKTVPILSNLARPTPASSRKSGSSKLSQSVPSEPIWKQNGKVKNTPRKSSLCSSIVVEEGRTINVPGERRLFEGSKSFGKSRK